MPVVQIGVHFRQKFPPSNPTSHKFLAAVASTLLGICYRYFIYLTVAGGKSGKIPGRNLPTRTVANLRNSLVAINQSISNLLHVHFFHTDIRRATVQQFLFFVTSEDPNRLHVSHSSVLDLPRDEVEERLLDIFQNIQVSNQ
jgi:hypothetical protein